MAEPGMRQDRDLVLPPNAFAYTLDTTTGVVKVHVGPRYFSLTQTDRLVYWSGKKFLTTNDFDLAIQSFVRAGERDYIVLQDPRAGDEDDFPKEASSEPASALDAGRKIVLPGPRKLPLWPGQQATVIEGHRLNFNQYLVAQVVDADAARENAEKARVEPQAGEEGVPGAAGPREPREFRTGERLVIRGDEVSFYIPPTGIEVIAESGEGRNARYVRDAATLEQLEYSVLVSESGEKRYERGPKVVFPEPTEQFVTEAGGERKFRAIELNPQSALYIKVLSDYTHDGDGPIEVWRGAEVLTVKPGDRLREGDELFLTGDDTPIYFPRPEQAVIHYGNRRKHHAIAIPAGEGRYVLNRTVGEVAKVIGPKMFLPDPRKHVVVRRVLDQRTVNLWYPGNPEAALVNQQLAGEQAARGEETYLAANVAAASTTESGSLARSYHATATFGADRMTRRTEYTPPRTITLDTKYLGPPRISVWPGYAVLVMDPTGNRRVEVGPVDLLLEYHETLMSLTLSTGRPKGSGQPFQTVYLRTVNNAVGDRVTVETDDLVPVTLELSLRVNFEAESPEEAERWFAVEDYIALLTDHVRSKLRNLAKRHKIERFYKDAIDLVRDALLGESAEGERTGLIFEDNGMRLYDVEVLNVSIAEPGVKAMMDGAMNEALRGAIQVSQAEEATKRDARLEELERLRIEEREKTAVTRSTAAVAEIERDGAASLKAIQVEIADQEEQAKAAAVIRAETRADVEQELDLVRARDLATLDRIRGEVDQFVRHAQAVDPKLVDAIRVYGQEKAIREISEALAPAVAMGIPAVDILKKHFTGTAFAPFLDSLAERPFAELASGNGQDQ